MIITGKVVDQIEIKAAGEVFHDLFTLRPYEVTTISPDKVQGCNLLEGEWGRVGSIIHWDFTHEGMKKSCREVIEAIDDENKIVKLRFIDGEILEQYKTILFTIHVQTQVDKYLATWTIEYEKLNQNVPDPVSLMELHIELTKDIEAHYHDKKK